MAKITSNSFLANQNFYLAVHRNDGNQIIFRSNWKKEQHKHEQ